METRRYKYPQIERTPEIFWENTTSIVVRQTCSMTILGRTMKQLLLLYVSFSWPCRVETSFSPALFNVQYITTSTSFLGLALSGDSPQFHGRRPIKWRSYASTTHADRILHNGVSFSMSWWVRGLWGSESFQYMSVSHNLRHTRDNCIYVGFTTWANAKPPAGTFRYTLQNSDTAGIFKEELENPPRHDIQNYLTPWNTQSQRFFAKFLNKRNG